MCGWNTPVRLGVAKVSVLKAENARKECLGYMFQGRSIAMSYSAKSLAAALRV